MVPDFYFTVGIQFPVMKPEYSSPSSYRPPSESALSHLHPLNIPDLIYLIVILPCNSPKRTVRWDFRTQTYYAILASLTRIWTTDFKLRAI